MFGDDTPTGSWRTQNSKQSKMSINANATSLKVDEYPKSIKEDPDTITNDCTLLGTSKLEKINEITPNTNTLNPENETIKPPSPKDAWKVALSLPTFLVALPYLCSFGSELAVEGIISDFYIQTTAAHNGQVWSSQLAGNWAAIFGLLNIFTRPLGGYFSDVLYLRKGLPAKKYWMICLGVMQGLLFILIGFIQSKIYPLIGLMTCLAIFMEGANGAVFSLVPAIHPTFNGVVSGITGAFGNVGGILFGLIFRFNGSDYHTGLLITGIICVALNLIVTCVRVP